MIYDVVLSIKQVFIYQKFDLDCVFIIFQYNKPSKNIISFNLVFNLILLQLLDNYTVGLCRVMSYIVAHRLSLIEM